MQLRDVADRAAKAVALAAVDPEPLGRKASGALSPKGVWIAPVPTLSG